MSEGSPIPHLGGETPALTHRRIQVIYFGLMLGVAVAALDQTIVATALPTISGDLGGINELSWVVTSYLLASTATTPLFGKLGDLYGRKIVFQFAIVAFLLGSVMSGFAHSMLQLIVFRAVQGLGAGGIIPQVMSIIGDVLSPRMRGKYQGYMNAVFTVSAASGPAIGGLLTEHASWRWCFYVNIPIGITALLVTSAVLDLPFTRVRHKVDYQGAALLMAAVTGVLLVTVWGGEQFAWTSLPILSTAGATAVLVACFIAREHRAEEALLPLHLWRNSTFCIVNATGFLVMMALTGTITYLPLFLQLVTGISPTLSGILIVPESLGIMLCSIVVGRRVAATGRYKRFPVAGSLLMTAGVLLLSTLSGTTGLGRIAGYMVVLGIGVGGVVTVIVVALQNDVSQREMGTATSAYMFFRNIGSSVGAAVYGAIMNARLRDLLPRLLPPGDASRVSATRVAYSPAAVRHLPGPLRHGLVIAFGRSLHTVFTFGIPVALATVVLAACLKERPLRVASYLEVNAAVDLASAGAPVAPSPALSEDAS